MTDAKKKIANVLAKAWLDPKVMHQLKTSPAALLKEHGITHSGTVHVHENTASDIHIVVPRRPANLSDEDLRKGKVHPELCCTVCF